MQCWPKWREQKKKQKNTRQKIKDWSTGTAQTITQGGSLRKYLMMN